MINILLMKKTSELEELSNHFGYEKTFFLDENFSLVLGKNPKELLEQVKIAKKKRQLVVYKPTSEDMLRFSLEKADVDIVYGMEEINEKDSLHFVRGGLDQVTCKIAAEKGKTIAFSFGLLLNSLDRPKLLARMRFNIGLCRKYKVKTVLTTFASEMAEIRSAKDLEAAGRIIQKS